MEVCYYCQFRTPPGTEASVAKPMLRRCHRRCLFSLSFPFPHISHAKKRVKFATCFAGELWQEASEQKRWKVLNQRAEESNNIPEKLKRKIQFLPFLDLATVDSRHQYIHSLGSSLGTISVMYWEESYFSFIKKSILPKAWLVIGRQSWQMRK